jgi:hypothetical protein
MTKLKTALIDLGQGNPKLHSPIKKVLSHLKYARKAPDTRMHEKYKNTVMFHHVYYDGLSYKDLVDAGKELQKQLSTLQKDLGLGKMEDFHINNAGGEGISIVLTYALGPKQYIEDLESDLKKAGYPEKS